MCFHRCYIIEVAECINYLSYIRFSECPERLFWGCGCGYSQSNYMESVGTKPKCIYLFLESLQMLNLILQPKHWRLNSITEIRFWKKKGRERKSERERERNHGIWFWLRICLCRKLRKQVFHLSAKNQSLMFTISRIEESRHLYPSLP